MAHDHRAISATQFRADQKTIGAIACAIHNAFPAVPTSRFSLCSPDCCLRFAAGPGRNGGFAEFHSLSAFNWRKLFFSANNNENAGGRWLRDRSRSCLKGGRLAMLQKLPLNHDDPPNHAGGTLLASEPRGMSSSAKRMSARKLVADKLLWETLKRWKRSSPELDRIQFLKTCLSLMNCRIGSSKPFQILSSNATTKPMN